jgi:hypothetical protein
MNQNQILPHDICNSDIKAYLEQIEPLFSETNKVTFEITFQTLKELEDFMTCYCSSQKKNPTRKGKSEQDILSTETKEKWAKRIKEEKEKK